MLKLLSKHPRLLGCIAWLGAMLIVASVTAQVPMTGAGTATPTAPAGYTGPGDIVSSAFLWYGLRGYNSADTAVAANVCLPSDTTCDDLTLSNGDVVVPSSLSTCNITTVICTVKTLYDKSGNSKHVTNATEATRPTFRPAMASNNCPTTSKPCILFVKASSQFLSSGANTITQAQPYSHAVVFRRGSATGDIFYASGVTFGQGSADVRIFAGSACCSSAPSNDVWHALQGVFNGASSAIYFDGGSAVTGNPGTGGSSSNSVSIGNAVISANYDGYLVEAGNWGVAFDSTQVGNLTTNAQSYWGY